MDIRRFVTGTLVGGVAVFALGYVIFTMAFGAFYDANAGSATGVDRDTPLVWAVALGSLAYAALITFAMGRRADAWTPAAGLKTGAVVGFLIWCTVDFILYGATNTANLTRTVVDPLLEAVRGGIGGAVIALVAGKMKA